MNIRSRNFDCHTKIGCEIIANFSFIKKLMTCDQIKA